MLTFAPVFPSRRAPRVLCLGAHSDDLEIGCGGTILELAGRYPSARLDWVVMSGADEREVEARRSAASLLRGFARSEVTVARFRDGFLPYEYAAAKEFFEQLKGRIQPDLIFTHSLHDRHQDHRLVAELTWNTWRDAAILEYEIPKYEGDLQTPNVYMPLARRTAQRKIRHLMKHFASQRSRRWFTEDTFAGHLRLRGIECNAPSGLAESFHGRKVCL